jgi:hypothetical protein
MLLSLVDKTFGCVCCVWHRLLLISALPCPLVAHPPQHVLDGIEVWAINPFGNLLDRVCC